MLIGAGSGPSSCGLLWRRTPGTAPGTAGHTLTTALPWDQLKTMSARSTPCHRLGRSFPEPQTRPGLSRQWMRFKNDWCESSDKLIQLFDPPFDKGSPSARLHQRICAGHPRERRPIHPRRHLGRPGDRAAGSRRPRPGTLEPYQPGLPCQTPEEVQHYKVEPYVVCADVYGAPPHTGRGGWTWYTGSASWLYRVALETILGFRLRGSALRFEPCIPPSWPGFELSYRHRSATYRILVDNSAGTGRGVRSVELDGQPVPNDTVPLSDDGKTHNVRVQLG